ncbi:MAG TPA: hypothetical protein V6C65_17055 [Allocoleopsis sp.]
MANGQSFSPPSPWCRSVLEVKSMLKRLCLLSLMTIATLPPLPVLAREHDQPDLSTPPVEHAQAMTDWSNGSGDTNSGYANSGYANSSYGDSGYANSSYVDPGYVNSGYGDSGYAEPGYGYWDYSQPQSSDQSASANAIATGHGATATSNVNQFNYQSRYGNSGYSGNRYGSWAVPSIQISVQQGTANAISTGYGSTAASHLNQTNQSRTGDNYGDYYGDYYGDHSGDYYGGYWEEPSAQSSSQQAIGNAVATGDGSTAISNIDQYNYQNYGYPAYPDYGYGY